MEMWSTRNLIVTVLLVFFGICFLSGGIITILIFPSMFHKGIIQNKIIAPESKSYEQWVEPTIPIYMNVYFFNCTNIEAFIDRFEKPNLVEVGPYVFKEHRKKVNIEDVDDANIEYYQQKSWTFDPDASTGSLSDIIHTINVPVFAAPYKSRFKMGLLKSVASNAMVYKKAQVFVRKSVDEFMFTGYDDAMLDFAYKMKNFTKDDVPRKFGWFFGQNASLDGPYVVNNGKEDIQNVGYIKTWKNMSETPYFGEYCNYINGTAADVFPPFMYNNMELEFFASGLCRSLKFVYEKNVEVDDLPARRFVPKDFLLDEGEGDPENSCFLDGEPIAPGVFNVSKCRQGAPAFISYPHFLDADPSYSEAVNGMNPDPEKHRFTMDIQPDLGIPLVVKGRFQVNILVRQEDKFELMENFHNATYFPMFWFETAAELDDETMKQLKFVTRDLHSYVTAAAYAMISVGIVLVLIAVILNICRFMKGSSKNSQGKTYEPAPSKEELSMQMKEKQALT